MGFFSIFSFSDQFVISELIFKLYFVGVMLKYFFSFIDEIILSLFIMTFYLKLAVF